MFFLGYVVGRFIVRSPVGAVLTGIRQNADRTAALGHSVPGYKLSVFVLAAIYAGLAGALLGIFQSYMPPSAFSVDTSGQLVFQTVIGGAGTLLGPTVGAAVWLFLRDELQQNSRRGIAVDVHPGRDLRSAGDPCAQRALRHGGGLVAVASRSADSTAGTAPAKNAVTPAQISVDAPLHGWCRGDTGAGGAVGEPEFRRCPRRIQCVAGGAAG